MSKAKTNTRRVTRILTGLLGMVLLAHLIVREGPSTILHQVSAIGWGLVLVIALGGVNYLIRTYGWRLTFQSGDSRVSLGRLFALRLGSEAAGNFGIAGQVLGDAMRVSILSSQVPAADGISSVVLDRGLYMFTSGIVNIGGLVAAVVLMSASGKWRIYALVFAAASALMLMTIATAIRKRWRIFSGAARALKRVPALSKRLERKEPVIDAVEEHFLGFYHARPAHFWTSLVLNLACHGLAVLEVYLLFHLMGARVSFLGAFVVEAFTKLISAIGAINPGNVGTYEGGNMLLARLVGITSSAGLTIALCRRARSLFWAAVGALCFMMLSRVPEENRSNSCVPQRPKASTKDIGGTAVIIAADSTQDESGFTPELAQVGALPVLLRAILTSRALEPSRIIVCVARSQGLAIRNALCRTRRLPRNVEWRIAERTNLSSVVREVAGTADRVGLLLGSRTYKPAMLKDVRGWNDAGRAIALTTNGELAGIYMLSQAAARRLASDHETEIANLEDLHHWIELRSELVKQEVPPDSWQHISIAADVISAEKKLDSWLVKPTDGRFACMNRRISIPISRQLIKFPITPNMVTLFTFGVGLASGLYFSLGGYWNLLFGAFLSVWASILDGCDGEVARIKLQATRLGCWMDTICDYAYYLVAFGGLTIGLNRSSETNAYLSWGAALLAGSVMSFLVLGYMRNRMAGQHPETFLAVWQKEAESRSSNPLLYFGRQCEFIIRRCFFPYALLAFALLNILNVAFLVAAVGANVAWIIASYSWFRSSMNRGRSRASIDSEIAFSARVNEIQRAA